MAHGSDVNVAANKRTRKTDFVTTVGTFTALASCGLMGLTKRKSAKVFPG
jgi:hypothetical protein